MLLPQDDLNLACLLKSPLVGLDEDRLFTLAWNRPGHLWRAVRERAGDPAFAPAYALLSTWLRRVCGVTTTEITAPGIAAPVSRAHGPMVLLGVAPSASA